MRKANKNLYLIRTLNASEQKSSVVKNAVPSMGEKKTTSKTNGESKM